jgi:AcrR family transcriptional regulator
MLSLASELGISTKTLYKHFPTKADLIQAVVELNDLRFNESRTRRIMTGLDMHQRMVSGALEWFELRSELGEMFWHELQRDYIEVYTLFEQRLQFFLEQSVAILKPEICDGLNKDYALSLLWKQINDVPSYEECEKFGLTRKDALVQAIDIWARGCLKMYQ